LLFRASQISPPAASPPPLVPEPQVQQNSPRTAVNPAASAGKPLPAKTYQEPSSSPGSSSPAKSQPKKKEKPVKAPKGKKEKKGKNVKTAAVDLPDGIEISWRKPPPPDEVAEAMKFLKSNSNKLVAKKEPDAAASTEVPESLVSCPFCRGQFADVSEHMDHCPVITGGGDPSI